MQPGDTVRTFTGRLGRVRKIRDDGMVDVVIAARIAEYSRPTHLDPPITVVVTYLRDDLTPLEELPHGEVA